MSINMIDSALRTISMEQEAISALKARINEDFSKACELLLNCQGRVIVTGMGKSGHIGNKLAATLASTGTPAFFVHPGEASHGDMGMITADDVVIALSNSGSTAEIITLLPLIKRLGISLISMTGAADSTLAQAADVNLDVGVETEACPLGLAPTSSTTVCLVMGDALAIALLEARGFSAEDFAFSHPGGALGRRLLLKVDSLMHTGEAIPKVKAKVSLKEALFVMTSKGLGLTTVIDDNNKLQGVFTDGDLRRALDKDIDLHSSCVRDYMSLTPQTIAAHLLAAEALKQMEDSQVSALIVVDASKQILGVIHLHDLLKAGVA